jgi:aminoglycoside 3-N-acetyltransferase I
MLELELQLLQPKNTTALDELITVFAAVFEMEPFVRPSKSHLSKLLNKEHFFAVTATIAGKVIGGLTFYVLDQYYSERPLAYMYDLAVLTEFQRKGVGSKLIAFTNHYCKERGFEEVFVQAEQVDDYAIDFYRATGPTREEQVVHFSYHLRSNRDKK